MSDDTTDWTAMSVDEHLAEAAYRGSLATTHAAAALVIAIQDQTEAIRELTALLRDSGKFSLR